MNKFIKIVDNLLNEENEPGYTPVNPSHEQLKAYFTRSLNTPGGRKEIVDMLIDIFTETESNIIRAVEEHYQQIRAKAKSLQQRNAPLGKAAVARNQNKASVQKPV